VLRMAGPGRASRCGSFGNSHSRAGLQVPLSELHAESEFDSEETETRRDKERQRILRALRACNSPLGGPNGAGAPRLQAHHASVQAEWFRNQSRRVSRLTWIVCERPTQDTEVGVSFLDDDTI
jgi:hypothetical protein